MIRRLIGAGMLLLAACATEPDPALVVSGTVRSAATQARPSSWRSIRA